MATCLICQTEVGETLSIKDILWLRTLTTRSICTSCEATFTTIPAQRACAQCGRYQDNQEVCQDCQRWRKIPGVVQLQNRAIYQYTPAMKAYMQQYKFNGDLRLASVFKTQVQHAIHAAKVDVVVPIPVSSGTFAERGFNQAVELIGPSTLVCEALEVTSVYKTQQSKQDRRNRMTRTQPFAIKPKYAARLRDKRILIFDDVYTTGRTLHFAAQALQTVEATSMVGLTLAR
ncbi:MAG TPA: ComF family protein [Lactobacillus sp.]|nr:ComF family protein [Lactobacillus sp.]